jgi:hypothetical protein
MGNRYIKPALPSINRNKSDKLPSHKTLLNAKSTVLEFWQSAWGNDSQFFMQTNIALPNLAISNTSYEDAFDAMVSQRQRIKQVQQLVEW